jgi:hypothetical protein
MKGMVRKCLLTIACGLMVTTMVAQEQVEAQLSADVVSTYVWRGMDLGNASLQPTLGVAWKGLSLSAWGSVGIARAEDMKELDLTLQYTTGGLTLGVVDYWNDTADKRYLYYQTHGTGHAFEGFVGYDFGPLSLSWQTIFAGNDGKNNQDKRAYSSYAELQAPFRLASCDWQAIVGLTPYASTLYGTTGFAVNNVSLRASKAVKLTDQFSLPLFAQLMANPCSGKLYFVFGITISAD